MHAHARRERENQFDSEKRRRKGEGKGRERGGKDAFGYLREGSCTSSAVSHERADIPSTSGHEHKVERKEKERKEEEGWCLLWSDIMGEVGFPTLRTSLQLSSMATSFVAIPHVSFLQNMMHIYSSSF
jgi:hypothetical protein